MTLPTFEALGEVLGQLPSGTHIWITISGYIGIAHAIVGAATVVAGRDWRVPRQLIVDTGDDWFPDPEKVTMLEVWD